MATMGAFNCGCIISRMSRGCEGFFFLFLILRSCVGLFLHRVFQTMRSCIVMTRCVSSAVSSILQTDNSCSLGSVGEKSIHINTKRSYCPLSLNQFPKNQFFLSGIISARLKRAVGSVCRTRQLVKCAQTVPPSVGQRIHEPSSNHHQDSKDRSGIQIL